MGTRLGITGLLEGGGEIFIALNSTEHSVSLTQYGLLCNIPNVAWAWCMLSTATEIIPSSL